MADLEERTGGAAPRLFLDKTEDRRAKKKFMETGPTLTSRSRSGTALTEKVTFVFRKPFIDKCEMVPLSHIV